MKPTLRAHMALGDVQGAAAVIAGMTPPEDPVARVIYQLGL